jgi:uncharacterized protein YxjI
MADLLNASTLTYPLTLRFKLVAISNQFELRDGQHQLLGYVRQPWAKIREAVSVFSDTQQSQLLYTVKADRILDFGAKYAIANAHGQILGELKREAVKSFFKASYSLAIHRTSPDGFGASSGVNSLAQYSISETNPWVKVLDGLLSEIPVIGMLTNYFMHPRYAVKDASGRELLEIRKRPSFFERKFELQALEGLGRNDEKAMVLACLMMILLESKRG